MMEVFLNFYTTLKYNVRFKTEQSYWKVLRWLKNNLSGNSVINYRGKGLLTSSMLTPLEIYLNPGFKFQIYKKPLSFEPLENHPVERM